MPIELKGYLQALNIGEFVIKNLVGVYGASGFSREVMPIVRDSFSPFPYDSRLVFIDDNFKSDNINSVPILTYDEFLLYPAPIKYVAIAIAESKLRQTLTNKLLQDNIQILDVKASNVIIMDEVRVGIGSILSPFVTLTSNINIGVGFHANIYSYVGHDCAIGNFVTFAPGVKCNGNVIVEDYAYLGTGAIIKQGRPGKPIIIGRGATVGMGSVVTKNVKAGETVIGNPARPLSKENLRAQHK